LSFDDKPNYESVLASVCERINDWDFLNDELNSWPSIRFGIETALLDLKNGGCRVIFPSEFSSGTFGIPINGLIWMGSPDFISQQVEEKLEVGFRCLKFKVGALAHNNDVEILRKLRLRFSDAYLEIRLDANGAYSFANVFDRINDFSPFKIHSMEQPIKRGQTSEMTEVCRKSAIPVALDEELIGIDDPNPKKQLLEILKPSYIVLKPSLIGGFRKTHEWIDLAEKNGTGWWVTSALESNIGLNAIAQWTYTLQPKVVQGLGTGNLFTNNLTSPLEVSNQQLRTNKFCGWDTSPCL
jgi:o-succinylbenzoate synthase